MPVGVTLRIAIKSLLANKLRSFLAMLGIIIGVGAVISMLAIGAGAKDQVMDQIATMGTNLIVVRPGQRGSYGVMGGSVEELTLDDAMAILEIDDVLQVSPVVRGNAQLKFGNNNTNTTVYGTAITYREIRNYDVEYGRFFTDAETENMGRVAVIGPDTAEQLEFTERDIGDYIKINGMNFKVVGILKSKGDMGWFSPDEVLMIPYTTAMNAVFGEDDLREIDVQADNGVDLMSVEDRIGVLMRERHRIREGDEDDFYVRNQADIIEAATETNKTFTVLLGAIASISLLVGGIGIMNIMLVTVTERTREIGIRKAIGAKERDIMLQFLLEAVIMSCLSGLLGVGVGLGASKIINSTTEYITSIQVDGIVLALSFAIAVGVFFGYYPARRAAIMDPIDSLYYE